MENLDNKRKIFLKKFEKRYKKFEKFSKYSGRGFSNRIKRLFYAPHIYIPYIFHKLLSFKYIKNKTTLFWGKEINFDVNDLDSYFLHLSGLLLGEGKLTKFFIKTLKGDDVFYDIGANHGFYTYLSLEFCKEVHSFEPLPIVFKPLQKNLVKTDNVFLNNVAVTNTNKQRNMYLSTSSGTSTINKDVLAFASCKYSHTIKVNAITLDEYISNHSKPTVIKIDIEGSESLLIKGDLQFLKNNSPIIAMEVWSGDPGKNISMKAVEGLRNLGFQPHCLNTNGEIYKIKRDLSKSSRQCTEMLIFKK
ncbi:MAG: FkbM family methyltransferase [Candidatus Pacebacteria bacterium]|jgi:FkbM family methyltransferase|nr:FkbM family methyltransferase [Candidatus Paceibacterota bacterium]